MYVFTVYLWNNMTDLIIETNQSAMQLLQTSPKLQPPTLIKSSISCEPIDEKLKSKHHTLLFYQIEH